MSDITAVVQGPSSIGATVTVDTSVGAVVPQNTVNVALQQQDTTVASTYIANPSTILSIGSIGNVDTAAAEDGSVLVYKETNSKWTATRLLNQQIMDAGEF